MMFAKDFNEILDEILTNYRNIGPIEMVDVVVKARTIRYL